MDELRVRDGFRRVDSTSARLGTQKKRVLQDFSRTEHPSAHYRHCCQMARFLQAGEAILKHQELLAEQDRRTKKRLFTLRYFRRWVRVHNLKHLFYTALKRYHRRYFHYWLGRVQYMRSVETSLTANSIAYKRRVMRLGLRVWKNNVDSTSLFLRRVIERAIWQQESKLLYKGIIAWKWEVRCWKGQKLRKFSMGIFVLKKWRLFTRWYGTLRKHVYKFYAKKRALEQFKDVVQLHRLGKCVWKGTSLARILARPILSRYIFQWSQNTTIHRVNKQVGSQLLAKVVYNFATRQAFQYWQVQAPTLEKEPAYIAMGEATLCRLRQMCQSPKGVDSKATFSVTHTHLKKQSSQQRKTCASTLAIELPGDATIRRLRQLCRSSSGVRRTLK